MAAFPGLICPLSEEYSDQRSSNKKQKYQEVISYVLRLPLIKILARFELSVNL